MEDDQLERFLSRAEVQRLRGLLEDRSDAIVSLLDAEARVLWATAPGSSGMFGRIDDTDYRGQRALDFVHPDDRHAYARVFASASEGSTVRWRGRAFDSHGRWVPVLSMMWRIQGGDAVISVTVPAEEGDHPGP